MLPVCIRVMAGSWLIASVFMLRMKHMSSTILAVCGSSSLTHIPLWPCWANLYFDGAIGNRFCPEVIVVSRWPLRIDSGRSLSYISPHLRLVVVQVELRRPADHVQVDDVLGLGGEVGQAGQAPLGPRRGRSPRPTAGRRVAHQARQAAQPTALTPRPRNWRRDSLRTYSWSGFMAGSTSR